MARLRRQKPRQGAAALLCLVAVTLAAPAQAHAATKLDMPPGPAKALYQRWVDQSAMPTANLTLKFRLGNFDAGHEAGMEYVRPSRRHPEGVAVRLWFPDVSYLALPDDRANPAYPAGTLESQRALFMHELGHVFDWSHRRDRDGGRPSSPLRRGFMRIMDLGTSWFLRSRKGEVFFGVPPAEIFADAYADCALPPAVFARYQGYGAWLPSVDQRAAVCALVRRTGKVRRA